jgi:bifunctional lysine-specific demethylase and histidyl-hydroxylase MINA
MTNLSPSDLLKPLSFDGFIDTYWLQRPFHQSGPSDRFSKILANDDIEFLALSLINISGWITLVKEGTDLPSSEVRKKGGFISRRAFRQARADGFTVLLSSLQCRRPEVAELCRSLEAEFLARGVPLSHSITANAYSTPAAARGFMPHYDDHEVLVLQLEGRKRWRVFPQVTPQPITRLATNVEEGHFGAPISEIWMEPGDILYIPRGFPHDATAVDTPTLHLSLAINVHNWQDLAIATIRRSPLFRASLPPMRGTSKQRDSLWAAGLKARLRQMDANEAAGTGFAEELLDAYVMSIEPALSIHPTGTSSPADLTGETRVRKCTGSFFVTDNRDQLAALLYPGGIYEGPLDMTTVFQFIASHETFAVKDLPTASPEAKLRIIGHLLSEGCLEISF